MIRSRLQDGCDVKERSSLQEIVRHDNCLHQLGRLTEASNATPVQLALALPRKEKKKKEATAPAGVANAKTIICFLHSSRGSPVARSEETSARDVGAETP